MWDAATGVELLTLYGHTGDILDVTMSPDSRYLVTNALDNTLRSYILPMNELLPLAQSRLKRSFTLDECRRYLHVDSCPAS